MESKQIVTALAALAHDARLAVFRLLVQAGPSGMAAGELAGRLGMPPSSLSFHLKELSHAGMVQSQQRGRFVIYAADFEAMGGLVRFLTDNCCGGQSCRPVPARPGRRKADRAKAKAV